MFLFLIVASLFALALHLSPTDPLDPAPINVPLEFEPAPLLNRRQRRLEARRERHLAVYFRNRAPVLLLALLLVPSVAHADIGSVALGSVGGPLGIAVSIAFMLASAFHVGDIIYGWTQKPNLPTPNIPGHPRITEALKALEEAGVTLLQKELTKDLLDALGAKLKTESFASIGAWLAVNYGPKLMEDLKSTASGLLGSELKIIFGSEKDLLEAATLRLGVAASRTVASAKVLIETPSGRVIVAPASVA